MIQSDTTAESKAKGIVMMLTGLAYEDASRVYDASGRRVKVAVVMERMHVDAETAVERLRAADGFLARALGEGA